MQCALHKLKNYFAIIVIYRYVALKLDCFQIKEIIYVDCMKEFLAAIYFFLLHSVWFWLGCIDDGCDQIVKKQLPSKQSFCSTE